MSSTELNVTWVEPSQRNGKIFLYFVYYNRFTGDQTRKRREEKNNKVVEVLGNKTETIIKGLKVFTAYYVTVTAANREDGKLLIGDNSTVVMVTTLAEGMTLL